MIRFFSIIILFIISSFLNADDLDNKTLVDFAKQIDQAFISNNGPSTFNSHYSHRRMLIRAYSGIQLSDDERSEFISWLPGMDEILGNNMGEIIKQGGHFRYLKIVTRDGEIRPFFRLFRENGSVDWFELVLEKGDKNNIQITDMYCYSTGELFSITNIKCNEKLYKTNNKGFITKIFNIAIDNEKIVMNQIVDILDLIKQKDFASALLKINLLPKQVQSSRNVLLWRIQAAKNISDEEYAKGLDEYASFFPKDPPLLLAYIDFYYRNKNYIKGFEVIKSIQEITGDDAYAEMARSSFCIIMDDITSVKIHIKRATQLDQKWQELWWLRFGIDIKTKDHADSVVCMEKMMTLFDIKFEHILAAPEYKDFIGSTDYAEFRGKHP